MGYGNRVTREEADRTYSTREHATQHQAAGFDEINVGSLDGVLTDDQPPIPHTVGGARHLSDAVADFNALLSDGMVDTITTGTWGTVYHKAGSSAGFTIDGGRAVLLTNDTGAATIKGTMIEASPSVDHGFSVLPAADINPIGVVYQDGVANGSPCWVVTGGRAQCLLEDGVGGTRDNWVGLSLGTAGRVVANVQSPASQTRHFQECGHCGESVSSGTDVLVWVTGMHFN